MSVSTISRTGTTASFRRRQSLADLGRSGTLHVPPDDDHAEEDSSGPDNEDCLCAFVAHIHVTPQRPNALPTRPHHSWCAAVTTRAPARHPRRREITDGTESPCGPNLAMSPTANKTVRSEGSSRGRTNPPTPQIVRAAAIRICSRDQVRHSAADGVPPKWRARRVFPSGKTRSCPWVRARRARPFTEGAHVPQ